MSSAAARVRTTRDYRGPFTETQARANAQRDLMIRRLADSGEPIGNLACLTGLSKKQVRRIIDKSDPDTVAAPVEQTVTPEEYKQFHREFARDPAHLPWLATLRVDARRNGRAMVLQGAGRDD